MIFPGFHFPSHLPSFVHHSDVLEYLQSYKNHYDLSKFIKLGTFVEKIVPVNISTGDKASFATGKKIDDTATRDGDVCFNHWGRFKDTVKWIVTTQDVRSGQKTVEEYDAVFVCNG